MAQNYQFALLEATVLSQITLSNKQASDSQAGILASNLLAAEYTDSNTVLTDDTGLVQGSVNDSGNTFSAYNQQYQNDAAVAQTGQNNANTAVQQQQTQVSQDATNLSNLVSLTQTLITIGSYIANLLTGAYT
jgi:hypothetical protein